MLKCSFWYEIIILKNCLQSFSQQFCPFSLLFNPILTLQKTLPSVPSVPSVFVSYFFIFPLFPKNQDFSIRYYFISQRYSFISQRSYFISQRYFIISQRYFPSRSFACNSSTDWRDKWGCVMNLWHTLFCYL